METYKVFGIGLNKTGTTTLAICLQKLGFQNHVSVRRDLLARYREGRLEDVFAVSDANQTFEDWPWPLMYKELFARYGDTARYILTKRRSSQSWLNSLKRHSLRTPVDKHCRLLAYGYNYPHGMENYHLELYEKHNIEVREFFAEQGAEHLLLEISFDSGDGWDELCGFLGYPSPADQLPHENRGDTPIPAELEHENARRINEQMSLLDQLADYSTH
ncbi:sulfotransferase [Pseudomonas nitroreducens]|uniref:sulfotransferase n=1 Tax=Pseudomonas TaxID=286 RepID=UPI0003754F7D|nr:sulfotransferase [Pseudomonas nitroreducens]